MIILYDYPRSTACYRVRIALALKNINYKKKLIHLVNNKGEQHHAEYQAINPQALVPTLQIGGQTISQSIAIIDYLEQQYPEPALLPTDPWAAAQLKRIAQIIACDIHPLNNLRVLTYLQNELGISEQQKINWYHHWLKSGFTAIEQILQTLPREQAVCYGKNPSYADLFLIPQVYNANRYEFSLQDYPLITEINAHCLCFDEFKLS